MFESCRARHEDKGTLRPTPPPDNPSTQHAARGFSFAVPKMRSPDASGMPGPVTDAPCAREIAGDVVTGAQSAPPPDRSKPTGTSRVARRP